MHIRFYQPHALLKDFVSGIMFYQHEFDKGTVLPLNVFPPIPHHSIYFYPRDPLIEHALDVNKVIVHQPSIVVGPSIRRIKLSFGYNHVVIRVGFHVGGLHRLFHFSMHELFNHTCSSDDFFGNEINAFNERLANTQGEEEMINVIQEFLLCQLKRMKEPQGFDRVMSQVSRRYENATVDMLARDACLSPRQFERKCNDRIGLPPKLFLRLIRFSKAYNMREARPHLSWTDIAHMNGYYDQAHFIRDFKEFAGVTPSIIDEELLQTPLRLQEQMPF